jgi:hypothetical protein
MPVSAGALGSLAGGFSVSLIGIREALPSDGVHANRAQDDIGRHWMRTVSGGTRCRRFDADSMRH